MARDTSMGLQLVLGQAKASSLIVGHWGDELVADELEVSNSHIRGRSMSGSSTRRGPSSLASWALSWIDADDQGSGRRFVALLTVRDSTLYPRVAGFGHTHG